MLYLETAVELIIGFFALLILTKLIGRSSIAEATPFDFVATLVLGEFVGMALFDDKVNIWKMLFSIVLWGLLILAIDFITLKFNRTRSAFESQPAILINNGVINRTLMKKNKIDMNRLQSMLRENNAFSMREVAHAILEPNGKLSILKRPIYDPVTQMDLDVPVKSVSIPITLISDGVIIKNNLEQISRDQKWLDNELAIRQISSVRDVMIAEWRVEDGLYIQKIYAP